MRVLTSQEVQQAGQEAAARPGMSALVLLQRAGSALAQFCAAHFRPRSVCAVCGGTAAGGAGIAAAEALRAIAEEVAVIVLARGPDALDPDTAAMCSRLTQPPLWAGNTTAFDEDGVRAALQADLILDAIAASANLTELEKKAVEAVNDSFGTVVSADLPSGVDPESRAPVHARDGNAVFAHGIVAFVAPKPAHVFGELTAGPIAVSEIGVQPAFVPNKTELQVITGQEVGIAFPARIGGEQPGSPTRVLVVAGSRGKAGHAALAGLAALRAGAARVTVACPASAQVTVAGLAPELVTEGLPESAEGLLDSPALRRLEQLLPGSDAVIVGFGLPAGDRASALVRALAAQCPAPLIFESEALAAFNGNTQAWKAANAAAACRVLVPAPQQATELLGVAAEELHADRLQAVRRLAQQTGACVVLPGRRPLVAGRSGETWVSLSGTIVSEKGGFDEVLAGIIAATLARNPAQPISEVSPAELKLGQEHTWMHALSGIDPGEKIRQRQAAHYRHNAEQASAFLQDVSVAAAVYLHGVALDLAGERLHPRAVLASDAIASLAEAFHECDLQRDQGLFYLQR